MWSKCHRWYILIFALITVLAACKKQEIRFQGYFEGEYLYMAPSVSGHLNTLDVQRGQLVNLVGIGNSVFEHELAIVIN